MRTCQSSHAPSGGIGSPGEPAVFHSEALSVSLGAIPPGSRDDCSPCPAHSMTLRSEFMSQYIFTMDKVGKVVPPKKHILKDISLSFFPGAKIGVLGLNGSGKSTLLRIMAGVDKDYLGEARPQPGINIGYLPQEPELDPSKNVREIVEEALTEILSAQQRLDEVYAAYAEEDADFDKLAAEQAKLEAIIETSDAHNLERKLEIAADALFLVMAFRMPEFLQMIVPLSLYIGLLLVLGRMHMDNEMVVLQAGGQGHRRIVRSLILPILMATTLVAMFSLYVTPRGDAEVNRIFEEQKDRSVLELLTPGRFHVKGSSNTQRATYAEQMNREKGVLENVFVADARFQARGEADRLLTVWAKSGKLVQEEGISYLLLTEGFQYQGKPGQSDYKEIGFKDNSRDAMAELQWRISLILTVPIMALAAIPLARVNPRQGRFYRLIPAVLGYMLYVGMLLVTRSAIEDHEGALPWYLHTGWVHLTAVIVVFLLYFGGRIFRRRRRA